jgi:hypothetical protein
MIVRLYDLCNHFKIELVASDDIYLLLDFIMSSRQIPAKWFEVGQNRFLSYGSQFVIFV